MGEEPSTLKDAVLRLGGNLKAMFHASADDEVLKATFANASFEHYEIAAYRSLIALAERCGETEVAAVCRRNLKEEQAMADFIDSNIEAVTLAYPAGDGRCRNANRRDVGQRRPAAPRTNRGAASNGTGRRQLRP